TPAVSIGTSGKFVMCHHLVPHPHRHEDMGGHVLGMGGVAGDESVATRSPEAQRGVNRVVVGVDQIVERPGMLRVPFIDLLGHGCRTHVGGDVPSAMTGTQYGECIERSHVLVVRPSVPHTTQ